MIYRKKIVTGILASLLAMSSLTVTSFASAPELDFDEFNRFNYSIEIEDDTTLEGATLVDYEEYFNDGKYTTVKTYIQTDGTTIVDTFTINAANPYSPSGSDTATRTRDISGYASITLTGSFDWYTEGMFAYVRCSSVSASKTLHPSAGCSEWETSRTENYVSIGTANASVQYYFYDVNVPFAGKGGTFKITCDDTGKISDSL